MRAPPDDLGDGQVLDALRAGWGIDAVASAYQPVGFGTHHWLVTTSDGRRWFANVDELTTDDYLVRLHAALRTARAVADAGGSFALAPVPAQDGEAVHPLASRFAVSLYPYVDGRSWGTGEYRTDEQRLAVLELLVSLHTADSARHRHALVDDFVLPDREGLMAALEDVDRPWDSGPFAETTRELLCRNADDLVRLLDHYDRGAAAARTQADRMVLTHGEPHTENVLVTVDGGLLLIDWDTALLAPPERDLWVIEAGDGAVSRAYHQATGVTVLPDMLQLYDLRWDLAETALYVTQFHQPHRDDPNTRLAAENLHVFLDPRGRWPSLL